jgi:hypothetical protein
MQEIIIRGLVSALTCKITTIISPFSDGYDNIFFITHGFSTENYENYKNYTKGFKEYYEICPIRDPNSAFKFFIKQVFTMQCKNTRRFDDDDDYCFCYEFCYEFCQKYVKTSNYTVILPKFIDKYNYNINMNGMTIVFNTEQTEFHIPFQFTLDFLISWCIKWNEELDSKNTSTYQFSNNIITYLKTLDNIDDFNMDCVQKDHNLSEEQFKYCCEFIQLNISHLFQLK